MNPKTNNMKIIVVGSKVRDKAAKEAETGHSVASWVSRRPTQALIVSLWITKATIIQY